MPKHDPTAETVLDRLGDFAPQMPSLTPKIAYDSAGLPILRTREETKLILTRDGRLVRRTRTYHTVR